MPYRLFCRLLPASPTRRYRCFITRSEVPGVTPVPVAPVAWLPSLGTRIRLRDVRCRPLLPRLTEEAGGDLTIMDAPADTNGTTVEWDLFKSWPVDAWHDQLLNAFCTIPQKDAVRVGLRWLIDGFDYEGHLIDFAREGLDGGRPTFAAAAAVSGYLFDTADLPATGGGQPKISFDGVTWEDLILVQPDQSSSPPVDLPLVVDQEADACYLRVDWDQLQRLPESAKQKSVAAWYRCATSGTDLSAVDQELLSNLAVILRRSVGEVAAWPGEALGMTPALIRILQPHLAGVAAAPLLRSPAYVAMDVMAPTTLVGKRVHYQVELRDALHHVVAQGRLSFRRLRLDPPPMPTTAVAIMDTDNQVQLTVTWEQDADDLEVVVFAQKRPLDACGFFGTDDDLALEEGLRQSDLHYQSNADEQEPRLDWEGHPVARSLRGAYDQMGLEPWPNAHQGVPDDKNPRMWTATWSEPLTDHAPYVGYRLSLALRRKSVDSAEGVTGPLRPCAHRLIQGGREVPLFQLERIPSPLAAANQWTTPPEIMPVILGRPAVLSGERVEQSPDTRRHELDLRFALTRDDVGAVGGFAVYGRNIIGDDDQTEFSLIRTVEAVPDWVHRYRPLQIDDSLVVDRLTPLSPAPAAYGPGSPPARAVLMKDFVLGLQPGWRLVTPSDHDAGTPKELFTAPEGATEWSVLGRFLAWAKGAGLVFDLIAPAHANLTKERPELLAPLLSTFPHSYRLIQVLAHHRRGFLATVRLVLLPPEGWITLGSREQIMKLLGQDVSQLWVEREAALVSLPMDAAGRVGFRWDGVPDRWHHRLEVAVRKRDRYALARNAMALPASTLSAADVPRSHRQRVDVPRLEPAPDLSLYAVPDLERVRFRYVVPQQRRDAAVHALLRMRYGDLRLTSLPSWSFPEEFAKAYADFFDPVVPQYLPTGPVGVTMPTGPAAPLVPCPPGHEEMTFDGVVFYLDYEMTAQWRADGEYGAQANAGHRCLPDGRYAPDISPSVEMSADPPQTRVTFPLARLGSYLSPTLRDAEFQDATKRWNHEQSADLLPYTELPDLETSYLILTSERNLVIPLVEIQAPGFVPAPVFRPHNHPFPNDPELAVDPAACLLTVTLPGNHPDVRVGIKRGRIVKVTL